MTPLTYLINVVWVAVVKSSIWRAATAIDLILQYLGRSLIDLLAATDIVHVQERMPKTDIINGVAVVIHKDVPVISRVELDIHMLLNVCLVFIILGAVIGKLHA